MKKVLSAIGILLGILVIGIVILTYTIDGIVKSNIEDTGSSMLQTTVEVDDVNISLFGGTGTIDGITVHNPEGFADSAAIKLQQIDMKLDLSSLLSDTIVVDSLIIQEPELFFEQTTAGNNLNALTQNIDMESESETRVIIDYLKVNQGLVSASTDIGGERSAQAEFDQFELTGVGRTESNTMKQTFRQVLEPIIERAAQEALKEGLLDQAKEKLQDLLGS